MLREISFVRQKNSSEIGLCKKRWFSNLDMDLFVWFNQQTPVRFLLAYNKSGDEHAISWNNETGYRHDQVDSGETCPGKYKMSPILLPDGEFDAPDLARKFLIASENISPSLADFIYARLLVYPNHYASSVSPDTVSGNL